MKIKSSREKKDWLRLYQLPNIAKWKPDIASLYFFGKSLYKVKTWDKNE